MSEINKKINAHRKYIHKIFENKTKIQDCEHITINDEETYLKVIDWACYEVSARPLLEFVEDWYTIPASLFVGEHLEDEFLNTFGSMYHFLKMVYPNYEWVKSHFIDEF
jgi:hypothetical protein